MRDGRLAEGDLERVMLRQSKEGGRLGSLLVAEGLIDAETLTVYLGLELGIPIANAETFERCKRSAVLLLTPEQAGRFRCIPIVIQGQTLIVAVDNPLDMQLLEEISRATGYRIIPRVAPEITLYTYLERFYGLPQPYPFAQISARPPSAPAAAAGKNLPAPPLPGLPPKVAEPTAAPNPAPELRDGPAPRPVRLDSEDGEALELDADDLIEELEADEEETADVAPPATPTPVDPETPPPQIVRPEPLTQEAALKLISETSRRSDIADAILAHASQLFEVASLLLVRDNMAFGWKGFGPGLDTDRIETLLIPLSTTSMFKTALGEERHFRGHAFSSSLHNHWFRVLRTPTPKVSIVVICSIGKRIVNLLYGHTEGGEDLDDSEMDGLMDIMNAAARAYMRLISKSKDVDVKPKDEEAEDEEAEDQRARDKKAEDKKVDDDDAEVEDDDVEVDDDDVEVEDDDDVEVDDNNDDEK